MKPAARLPINDLIGILGATELFGGLDASILWDIQTELEWVELPGGATLMRQGEAGDCLYILINGRLHVSVARGQGDEEIVGEVGRGETVGEMAILTGADRSATVRAVRDTELIRFSTAAFERIVERHPQFLHQIVRILGIRLRQTVQLKKTFTTPVTFAVVKAGQGKMALSEFVRLLSEALGRIGPTLHLDSRRFDSYWGSGSAQSSLRDRRNVEISNWLGEQENDYRFVVYESDESPPDGVPSNWTNRCVRQADRILVVGDSSSDSSLNMLERRMMFPWTHKATTRRELVLLHHGNTQPRGTEHWLKVRHVEMHHHIRWTSASDFDRLARLLTGRAIGVVLGGGGARGVAHIGVLRAFQEKAIPIDFIAGTSVGSVLAAEYAMGWDWQTMLEETRQHMVRRKPFRDYTIPVVAFVAGRKFKNTVRAMFGDTRVEDLWLNYFCVSSNLTTAEQVVHRRGVLWECIWASGAIPAVVVPRFCDGNMLVDGGVLNNLPGDVMRQLCNGFVVAVDVSPQKDQMFASEFQGVPSGWQIFWSKVNPFCSAITKANMFHIIVRTGMLSSVGNSNLTKRNVDLYLHPPTEQFGMFEFEALDKIMLSGYEYALREIENWDLMGV